MASTNFLFPEGNSINRPPILMERVTTTGKPEYKFSLRQ